MEDDGGMSDDDSGRGAADEHTRLVELLRRLGAGEEEITEALDLHAAGALALEAALRHGRPPISPADAAQSAGMTAAEFADLWRALGFTAPGGPGRVAPSLVEALPVIATATREWLGGETRPRLAPGLGRPTPQPAEAVGGAIPLRLQGAQVA